MMHVVRNGDRVRCEAATEGRIAVYLDTDMLQELAKGPETRRARFVTALRRGGTLLFSMANAVEVAILLGRSANTARELLASVGRYWVPLELNFLEVVRREDVGDPSGPVWQSFLRLYVEARATQVPLSEAQTLDDDTFFNLGVAVEWWGENRDEFREQIRALSSSVSALVARLRASYEADPASLNRAWPPLPFSSGHRTRFVLGHLLRLLVLEAKARRFQENDALDLCHAVSAATYASLATLDKAWKRRVSRLPGPCSIAQVFYRREADEFVARLESLVAGSAN